MRLSYLARKNIAFSSTLLTCSIDYYHVEKLGRLDWVAGFDGAACAASPTFKAPRSVSWAPQLRRLSHGVSYAD